MNCVSGALSQGSGVVVNAVVTEISTVASVAEETYNTITNTVTTALSCYVSAKSSGNQTGTIRMGNNPDFGVDDLGNIVLKDVSTEKTLSTG